MKRIWLVLMALVGTIMLIQGCTKRWEEEEINYVAPNWTSDGKIVFVEEKKVYLYEQPPFLDVNVKIKSKNFWLCEIANNGTGKHRIANISSNGDLWAITNTSSALDYVVIGEGEYKEIWVIKRDGTELKKVGSGTYPDFSPDAEKIVYQKKDQGIWIMNRDGSGEHQIISDGQHPAWSPEGGRIAYVVGYPNVDTLLVVDTIGILLKSFSVEIDMPDWGPIDSSAVSGSGGGHARILYYDSGNVNNLSSVPAGWGGGAKWSPEGSLFIGWVSGEFCITDRNSGNKWYLKP